MTPALVAVRDGADAPWRPAVQQTATTFVAEVHGPYVVTVVCADVLLGPGLSATSTTQSARTPDDPHDLVFCNGPAPTHDVTGRMVQPGFVQLGDARGSSPRTPDWPFALAVPDGTYDLIATTTDAIALRRGIAVTEDRVVTPDIDVAQEGTAFVGVAFTAPNAIADEHTEASVGLLNPTNPNLPARIYLGALDTAKAAPDAALIDTDVQSVSVRGLTDTTTRALRRPFRVGGDTVFTLPPPIGGLQWTVQGGELSARWDSVPPFDRLSVFAAGTHAGSPDPVDYSVDVSPGFAAATGLSELAIDTDIAGFQPEWRIDFDALYDRDFTVQQGTETGVLTTSSVNEVVNASPVAGAGALASSTPARRASPRLAQP